jgi:hypothetical protein
MDAYSKKLGQSSMNVSFCVGGAEVDNNYFDNFGNGDMKVLFE